MMFAGVYLRTHVSMCTNVNPSIILETCFIQMDIYINFNCNKCNIEYIFLNGYIPNNLIN